MSCIAADFARLSPYQLTVSFFFHFFTISFISTNLFWFLTLFHYASISLYCDNRKDYYFVTESCFDCESIKIAASVVTIYFGLNSEQYGTTLFFKKLSYSLSSSLQSVSSSQICGAINTRKLPFPLSLIQLLYGTVWKSNCLSDP